jgi:two-component system NtrC family sensor kinase
MADRDPVQGRRRRPWNRLAFRIILGLLLAGALALVGAGWLNLHLQQEHLLGLMESRAAQSMNTVLAVTRGAMLANDKDELVHLVDAIAGQDDIRRIRLFDAVGQMRYSSGPEGEVPAPGITDAPCSTCHQYSPTPATLPGSELVRVIADPHSGGRLLEVIAPVPNEAQCSASGCHSNSAQQQILGVLEAQISLAALEEDLSASSRELAAALFFSVVATVGIVGALTWRWVLRPVGELTSATGRLAAGDLTVRVQADSADELGDLGRAWNHMAGELAAAREDLAQWGQTLERRVADKTEELEQAQKQMLRVERRASLGALAAEVAHEINNPLAGIATYARLMRRKLGFEHGEPADPTPNPAAPKIPRAELANVFEMIDDEARRCGRIVRNLLLFSRTPTARVGEVDLGALLQRCCMLVGHKAELADISVRSEVDPSAPMIAGDAAQLEQMLLGLVMNAIEACEAGDTVTVTISPGAGSGVRLVVADTGRGIPAVHRDKIFEPFFSTKEESSGIGLGLAVVYGIVQRHGGAIDIESEEGLGTRMIVDLAARPPEQDPVAEGPDQIFSRRDAGRRSPGREEES